MVFWSPCTFATDDDSSALASASVSCATFRRDCASSTSAELGEPALAPGGLRMVHRPAHGARLFVDERPGEKTGLTGHPVGLHLLERGLRARHRLLRDLPDSPGGLDGGFGLGEFLPRLLDIAGLAECAPDGFDDLRAGVVLRRQQRRLLARGSQVFEFRFEPGPRLRLLVDAAPASRGSGARNPRPSPWLLRAMSPRRSASTGWRWRSRRPGAPARAPPPSPGRRGSKPARRLRPPGPSRGRTSARAASTLSCFRSCATRSASAMGSAARARSTRAAFDSNSGACRSRSAAWRSAVRRSSTAATRARAAVNSASAAVRAVRSASSSPAMRAHSARRSARSGSRSASDATPASGEEVHVLRLDRFERLLRLTGALLQRLLDAAVDLGLEQRLEDVFAAPGVGFEQLAELALGEHDDPGELVALESEQPLDLRRHAAGLGCQDLAFFLRRRAGAPPQASPSAAAWWCRCRAPSVAPAPGFATPGRSPRQG